jgi:Primase X
LNSSTRKSDQHLSRILKMEVIEGIDLLLGLFEKAGQRAFPRKIMTVRSNGQITVYSKEEMLRKFEDADFIDCRVNAYPLVPKDVLQVPNIILVDIDINRSLKTGHKRIATHLNKTLQKIREYTSDSIIPLILWTGNGYHVIVVLNMTEPLEHIEEYTSISSSCEIKQLSREFMLFARMFLSENKADPKNNPSFESCLLRVPYTLNLKCLEMGMSKRESQVKIVQSCNNSATSLNEISLLLSGFCTYLVNKKINYDKAAIIEASNKRRFSNRQIDSISWIERLLQRGLAEHRKYVIRIILVPYLTNIRHLTREHAAGTINQWLSKCNICRPLGRTFNSELKLNYHIKRCEINRNLKPIRFRRLLERNPELYKIIEEICDHA